MPPAKSRVLIATAFLVVSMLVAVTAFWFRSGGDGQAIGDDGSPGIVTRVSIDHGDGHDRIVDVSGVSAAQADALADGHVTWAEYEAAIRAAFACIQDAGYEPLSEPYVNSNGTGLIYAFHSHGDPDQSSVSRECREQHSMLVELSWAGQVKPSEQQAAAAWDALRECLVDGGLPVEVANSTEVLHELGEFAAEQGHGSTFSACGRSISQEFEVPGWHF